MIQGKKAKQYVHKVQILDPAVGTATFLNETIKFIYKGFKNQEGLWESYVQNELLPRLYGFELMMAPYTIAHLKLAMTLKDTGINQFNRRLGVYLTNTLEEGVKVGDDLFSFGLAEAISEEARSANIVKHDTPIMIVMGNPPYSGISSNMTEYANKLIDKYKVEPGGKEKLKERKHWLNDDYVKFIAFAENLIAKTGEGVVAMITNHGYLDNPTFRGMRWHLANTFSSIYLLDLHGSVKKEDTASDGGKDENVFDIQQGVSIIVGIKNKSNKKDLAKVYRADLLGRRTSKFEKLMSITLQDIKWNELELDKQSFAFIKNTDSSLRNEYKQGISIKDLFPQNVTGVLTMGDGFIINKSKEELKNSLEKFLNENLSELELRDRFSLGKNYAAWILENKNKGIVFDETNVREITYRSFDNRWIYFNDKFVWRMRKQIMQNFLLGENIGIVTCRQSATNNTWSLINITDKIVDDSFVSNRSKERGYVYPLYLYSNTSQVDFISPSGRKPNLGMNYVSALLKNIGKYEWLNDHKDKQGENIDTITPLDILDYTYATLHSQSYREKYKDFLKENFPRVPVPKNRDIFLRLAHLGSELRKLHLLENIPTGSSSINYPVVGDSLIDRVDYKNGKVFVNELQYFESVPKEVWEFYMGAYQPAQKWLKDRKESKLEYEDIVYYQKIIESIEKSIEIIKKIN